MTIGDSLPIATSKNRLKNSNAVVVSKTADYTAVAGDDVILVDATAGVVTITLPAAADNTNKEKVVKKVDSTINAVIIDGNGSETVDGLTTQILIGSYDSMRFVSDGSNWYSTGGNARIPRLLTRTLVLLTAVAQTTLLTVPAGRSLKLTDVVIEGDTVQSGGTSSKLLIGTTGASYAEMLNGSTGHTFISGTATSLLAAGSRMRGQDRYPLATASVADVNTFAAASVIKADVSGTVCTAGKVLVDLFGYFY